MNIRPQALREWNSTIYGTIKFLEDVMKDNEQVNLLLNPTYCNLLNLSRELQIIVDASRIVDEDY